MFRLCREKYFANYINEKKLKIINKRIDLLNRNAERFLGKQANEHLTSDRHKFKSPGSQSVMQLSPTTEKHSCSRNIHSSVTALSNFKGENMRDEKIKNYIFCGLIGGVCLAMFIFSTTMRAHEDYVIVNPGNKNK